jgi:CRP/FNR family transcriptional regulator, polysaccharide utilization system transcription regulator
MKFIARDAEGEETIVGLALEGETVGELAVLDGSVHPTDCAAATKARVLGIDAELFLDVLRSDGAAALTVARIMAGRLRWSSDTTIERAASEVPARLAGRLLGLAELLGTRRSTAIHLELPLAQGDLGRLAGMCRESTCKTMSAFRREGIVDYEGRSLRILRPDMLEHIRCAGRYRPEQNVSRAGRA